jgi:hypothetical protein
MSERDSIVLDGVSGVVNVSCDENALSVKSTHVRWALLVCLIHICLVDVRRDGLRGNSAVRRLAHAKNITWLREVRRWGTERHRVLVHWGSRWPCTVATKR